MTPPDSEQRRHTWRAALPTFKPPTYSERPVTGVRLIDAWVKVNRGMSVLKDAQGNYQLLTYPTTDDIAAATAVYLGGHEYVIDSTEAAALTAAGYGSYIT